MKAYVNKFQKAYYTISVTANKYNYPLKKDRDMLYRQTYRSIFIIAEYIHPDHKCDIFSQVSQQEAMKYINGIAKKYDCKFIKYFDENSSFPVFAKKENAIKFQTEINTLLLLSVLRDN